MPAPHPHASSWSAAIRSYTASHQHEEALLALRQMRRAGSQPDRFALAAAVKSCAALRGLVALGRSLHGLAVKGGCSSGGGAAVTDKALMDMYARFGVLQDSVRVFDEMDCRDSVSWNVLMSGYARLQLHSEAMGVFRSMHACGDEDARPSTISAAIVLPVCAKLRALNPTRSVHGHVIKTGLATETLVGNSLVSAYAKCGDLHAAGKVFNGVGDKDVVSWNSMIAGYAENGLFEEALGLFFQMALLGFCPNYSTVASVLPLCVFFPSGWFCGKAIHCLILRFGLEMDVSVGNALMAHYARIGYMKSAEAVFGNMHVKDVVSWNTMISGYAMNGSHHMALHVFQELLLMDMEPDPVTFISILPVCAQLNNVEEGRKIHDYVSKHRALLNDTAIGNALISFYGKCMELDDALQAFEAISSKDLISWNAMLTAYADREEWEELIGFLKRMLENGTKPDSVTILIGLQACAALNARMVMEVHGYSIRAGFMGVSAVGNAILDAYAKCGSITSVLTTFNSLSECNVVSGNTMITAFMNLGYQEEAESIFNQMQERDIGSWNLMIRVYARNDCLNEAIDLFRKLRREGLMPDAMSIMSVLPVCARLGSVHLVKQCHCYALRAFLDDLHLGGAFLDTYSKCGGINYAHRLFQMNPKNDTVMLTAMIGGFAMNGMAEEALAVYHQMLGQGMKPDHVIMTALLSACSHAGLVDEGRKIFRSINEVHGVKLTMEHYACIVDLLARRGWLKEAYAFIASMPCEPNANVWGTLLGACKVHNEVEIGRVAAEHLFNIESGNIGNYVVLSNIYAADGRWDGVEEVRGLMKARELRKSAGCSWIEVEKTTHTFVAGDLAHPQRSIIYLMLKSLDRQIKEPLV